MDRCPTPLEVDRMIRRVRERRRRGGVIGIDLARDWGDSAVVHFGSPAQQERIAAATAANRAVLARAWLAQLP